MCASAMRRCTTSDRTAAMRIRAFGRACVLSMHACSSDAFEKRPHPDRGVDCSGAFRSAHRDRRVRLDQIVVVGTMTDSQSPAPSAARPSDKPARMRLVIRAEILPDPPVHQSAPRPTRRIVLVAMAAIAVLVLAVIAISLYRPEPADSSRQELTSEAPIAAPIDTTTPAVPPMERGAAPAAPMQREPVPAPSEPASPSGPVPPAAIHETLPDPSQGALQTIRGTVRVSVRVTIDEHGNVIAAVPEDAGPSRYFERLSVEAARQWVFTPADHAARRTALLRFHFTREGTTARMDE